MIIEKQEDVTKAVLAELQRAPNGRFKEIMEAFVRHLHDFAREVKLTEEEFQAAVATIVALGKKTTETHNEVVLMSGSLGFSQLICLLNNGEGGEIETDVNLLGPFTTDRDGRIYFRSVKPAGYPIPIDGPVGDLLRAQGRHNMRPAHLHVLARRDGFKTLVSQVYVQDDKFLETDAQFGVTRRLIGNYVRHENGTPPASDVAGPWYSLDHTFTMEPGQSRLPKPPITGKASGERPKIPHLV